MGCLAVDRTPFQGQIVNCLFISQYLAEKTVFLSDNVSNGEAVQLYLILCRKRFFLFDFYESLLVRNHRYEIWRKSVPWVSRIPGTEGVGAKAVLQSEAFQCALPFEYFKPLNAASDNHCEYNELQHRLE
jgi:hypothetical protein